MSDSPTSRLRYFNGQFLDETDFNTEQAYHLARGREHNKYLHTYGIVTGLKVKKGEDNTSLTVEDGIAIDRSGREIVLSTDTGMTTVNILDADINKNANLYLAIQFEENPTEPQARENSDTFRRWQEAPDLQLQVIKTGETPSNSDVVYIAKFSTDQDGKVVENSIDQTNDPNLKYASAVLAERSVAVKQFKTQVIAENYDSLEPAIVNSGKSFEIEAYKAVASDDQKEKSNNSKFLLVYAYIEGPINSEPQQGLTWVQYYIKATEEDKETRIESTWYKQIVRFQTNSSKDLKFRFRIYALFES